MTTRSVPAGDSRSRRLARVLVSVAVWIAVLVAAWLLWPSSLGGGTTMIIVSGNSMEPTYSSGDVVVARAGSPAVGDVVVYTPEGYGDAKIIHRIIGGDGEAGWELRGDNNSFTDPFTPTDDAVLGIATLHLPKAGVAASSIANPWVWGLMLLAAAVLILWPSRDDDDDDDDAGDEAGAQASASTADESQEADEAPLTAAERVVHAALMGVVAMAHDARRGRPRRAAAVTAVLLAVLLAATAVTAVPERASAAQLSLSASGASVSDSAYCWTPGTNLASQATGSSSGGSYSQLQLQGVPTSCAGTAALITVHAANGSVLATGSATLAGGATLVTLGGAFSASSTAYVVVTAGAPRAATFTQPAPVFPPSGPIVCYKRAADGSILRNGSGEPVRCQNAPSVSVGAWSSNGANPHLQVQYSVTLAPTESSAILVFDFSHAAYGAYVGNASTDPLGYRSYNGGASVATGYSCGSRPVFALTVAYVGTGRGMSGEIRIAQAGVPNNFTLACQ